MRKTKDVRVRIRVREIQAVPAAIWTVSTIPTAGLGGILEAENRNFLGRASDLGLKLRYDSDLKEGRLYFYQPFVTRIHLKTDVSAFVQSETRTGVFSQPNWFFALPAKKSSKELSPGLRVSLRSCPLERPSAGPDDISGKRARCPAGWNAVARHPGQRPGCDTRGVFIAQPGVRAGLAGIGDRIHPILWPVFPICAAGQIPAEAKQGKRKKTAPTRLVYAGALRLGLTSAFGGEDPYFAGTLFRRGRHNHERL